MNRHDDFFEPQPTLVHWGAPNQVPACGSIGVAQTFAAQSGYAAVQRLLGCAIIDHFVTRNAARTCDAAIDHVAPNCLAEEIIRAERTLPPFENPNPDLAELEERHKLLTDVQGGAITRDARAFIQTCRAVAEDRFSQLKTELHKVSNDHPESASETLATCQQLIRDQAPARPDPEAMNRFAGTISNLRDLPQYEDQVTRDFYGKLQLATRSSFQSAEEEALIAVAVLVITDVRRQLLPNFERYCKKLRHRTIALRKKVQTSKDTLMEHERIVRAQETNCLSTTALLLDAGDENNVLSGFRQRLSCDNIDTLTVKLAELSEHNLRDVVSREHPHLDPNGHVAELISDLPVMTIAETLLTTIHEHRPEEQSLYQLLDRYGIERALGFLWHRSAPTCSLGGRDSELYGVSVDRTATLRLPVARTSEDQRIRDTLSDLFLEQYKGAHVQEAGEHEAEICLHRFVLGFPIAIENANHALLYRMNQAAESGHPPFLVGFVPDSENGQVPAAYRLLFEKEPENGNGTDAS